MKILTDGSRFREVRWLWPRYGRHLSGLQETFRTNMPERYGARMGYAGAWHRDVGAFVLGWGVGMIFGRRWENGRIFVRVIVGPRLSGVVLCLWPRNEWGWFK